MFSMYLDSNNLGIQTIVSLFIAHILNHFSLQMEVRAAEDGPGVSASSENHSNIQNAVYTTVSSVEASSTFFQSTGYTLDIFWILCITCDFILIKDGVCRLRSD